MKTTAFLLLTLLMFASCTKRNIVYFSDAQHGSMNPIQDVNEPEAKIEQNDLLRITVTSLSPEANVVFNKGEVIAVGMNRGYATSSESVFEQGYLVDKEGYIDFPILGKIHLGGLTKSQAKAMLLSRLDQYLEKPVVNISYLNFKITVLGEVRSPSTFTIPAERINVLEALGMAGDMTPLGKRDNVLIIREENGMRTMARIDLNSERAFNSPYFYLKQNDVVYVEPMAARKEEGNMTKRNISFGLSVASLLAILLTRVL